MRFFRIHRAISSTAEERIHSPSTDHERVDLRSSSPSTTNTPPGPVQPNDVEKQEIEAEIVPDRVSAFKGLGWLDRFLAVWIILAMAIGILIGNFVPNVEETLEKGKFVDVSVPVAVGLLIMMYPVLCKGRFNVIDLCRTELTLLQSSTKPYISLSNRGNSGSKWPSASLPTGSSRLFLCLAYPGPSCQTVKVSAKVSFWSDLLDV